jgi:hypothetical protein
MFSKVCFNYLSCEVLGRRWTREAGAGARSSLAELLGANSHFNAQVRCQVSCWKMFKGVQMDFFFRFAFKMDVQ